MKPHHPKGISLHFTLLSSVASLLLATACSSSSSRRATWLSEAGLQACKAAALDAFAAADFTVFQRDENRPALIRVDDWRVPIITVYLPMTERLPNTLTYVYYRLEGTERFAGRPELEAYALREGQALKLIEEGLVSWGTGPLINRDVRLGDQ